MYKVFLGAIIGLFSGYYIPPGCVFWGIVGAIVGYLLHRYSTLE